MIKLDEKVEYFNNPLTGINDNGSGWEQQPNGRWRHPYITGWPSSNTEITKTNSKNDNGEPIIIKPEYIIYTDADGTQRKIEFYITYNERECHMMYNGTRESEHPGNVSDLYERNTRYVEYFKRY